MVDLIELLFFAYRDFISDPDAILAKSDFGRAHHRVLHFVNRNPGLTVADLLDILKITKQSLARVLKELVDSGFIEQRTGPQDRRQRLLFATAAGQALSREPLGAAGAAHQGGARRARPGRPRDGDGLPVRHDRRRRSGRRRRGSSTRRASAMSMAAPPQAGSPARRRAASPRRRRRHAHPHAADALPRRARLSRHRRGFRRGGAPADRGIAFDLLVVDVMMPGESGLEFTEALRQTSAVPILMLTARSEVPHRIRGLEVGADDYLAKPFEPRELLLRITSILKRGAQPAAPADRDRSASARSPSTSSAAS